MDLQLVLPCEKMPFHLGQGWGQYEVICLACGLEFTLVVPVGIKGFDCPLCHYHNGETFQESTNPDMPFIDGPWLANPLELLGKIGEIGR